MEDPETCYGPGSVAGAVIGTFLTTSLLLAVAGLFYRQWRRNKGKHLVLVTDPEIVEEAYAFDNPCFKDSATPAVGRSLERHQGPSLTAQNETSTHHHGKDQAGLRWSTPWANLGKHEKRRTLDDSCLGPKAATRVSVVQLRSRDFTGLGFNVCGNMREGIFVKDLLHRGPASESGRIHPGDRISSVKISFRSMVYEDALTILSYASPYDVELEVESGSSCGAASKPSTLLKKSVGPSPNHICHPLYRSQSIPDLSSSSAAAQSATGNRKYANSAAAAKRLFAADPNDSSYSNYSTMNSTLKSTKSTPGSQTLERRHEELMANRANNQQQNTEKMNQQQHPKFGIKVLPALDGTVHRVENQNEHNTNLERRHSKKLIESSVVGEKRHSSNGSYVNVAPDELTHNNKAALDNRVSENLQQRSATAAPIGVKKVIHVTDGSGIDVPDRAAEVVKEDAKPEVLVIPSEVPAEVHNAAMAARRNRKSSNMELADVQKIQQQVVDATDAAAAVTTAAQQQESIDPKSPQKGKRKAPAPPSRGASIEANDEEFKTMTTTSTAPDEKTTNGISDYKGHDRTTKDSIVVKPTSKEEADKPQLDDPTKAESKMLQERVKRINANNRRTSESDTDSELQNNFTTIELNPSDITVHHTPVPEAAAKDDNEDLNDTEADEDDVYRKAASLGDLSKYNSETKSTALERAQSLDMTDTGSKKRKAPMPPPEDIHESTEDLSKLGSGDQIIDTFDRRKLKKSNEWGTLEDAIWSGSKTEESDIPKIRKKSTSSGGGTLERSKSNIEMKTTKDEDEVEVEPLNVSDGAIETCSLELYNLPLSKKLTQDFIRAERLFDPEEDNALARLVNDGKVVKQPTDEQVEREFRKAHPPPEEDDDDDGIVEVEEVEMVMDVESVQNKSPEVADTFEKAIRYFDMHTRNATSPPLTTNETKVQLPDAPEVLYAGKKEVQEEPMSKVTFNYGCPGCDHPHGRQQHSENCSKKKKQQQQQQQEDNSAVSYHQTIKVEDAKTDQAFETHFAKPILNVSESSGGGKSDLEDDDEDEATYVTVNSKNLSPSPVLLDKHNVSNVSVSSGENSEDSGLVRESILDYGSSEGSSGRRVPPLPNTPMPSGGVGIVPPQKMTYITEIQVSPANRGSLNDSNEDNASSDNEEIVSIMESSGGKKVSPEATTSSVTLNVTSNGKLPAGKKPPVPPRRSDAAAAAARFAPRTADGPEKQVVYVSEYKSPAKDAEKTEKVGEAGAGKKFENWVFLKDAGKEKTTSKEQQQQEEINPWGNGSSPSQPVTNIVLSSSGDEKIVRK